MLNIQILQPGNNVTLGKGLLRNLQNEFMPNLDLFVRESIQNSLDAAANKSRSVHVKYKIGNFKSEKLSSHLEMIGSDLVRDFPGEQNYISLSDFGTVGLTGPLTYSEVEGQVFGNLIKLVYDIAKPQEQEGAGGSWGYGKTIYYRMGIGLVIYYSRIEVGKNKFEERLAAVMVENEDDEDAYIPPYKDSSTRSGVAWWGELVGDNVTKPITDSKKIKEILNIFNIQPHKDKETGTTIIIPYINEKEIMDHNAIDARNGRKASGIYGDLAEYLEVVIQRWYTPRLNNDFYNLGNRKMLKTSINGKEIEWEDQHNYFKVLLDMYNYALTGKKESLKFLENEEKITRELINIQNINGVRLENNTSAFLTYGHFSYEELGMLRANHALNPHFLSNIENKKDEGNTTIITFCRQPGMFISYEDQGDWANNLITVNEEEYIIAVVVLNSNNCIIFDEKLEMSLEEYIRAGERSDHTTWEDHQMAGINPRIVRRIQSNVNNKLKKAFEGIGPELQTDNDGRLSRKAGELILPSVGYGRKARSKIKRKNTPTAIARSTRGGKTYIYSEDVEFSNLQVKIPLMYQILEPNVREIYIDLEINQDSRSLSLERFEEQTSNKSPISIKSFVLKNNKNDTFIFRPQDKSPFEVFKTNSGTCYRLSLVKDYFVGEILEGFIELVGVTQNMSPSLRMKIIKEIEYEG